MAHGSAERLSVGPGGFPGNGENILPSISPNERLVAVYSNGTNLVPGFTNGTTNVFVGIPAPEATENPDFTAKPKVSSRRGKQWPRARMS